MALDFGILCLAALGFLFLLPSTIAAVLQVYALLYPESTTSKIIYPSHLFSESSDGCKDLKPLTHLLEELVNQGRQAPVNPPILDLQTAELVRKFDHVGEGRTTTTLNSGCREESESCPPTSHPHIIPQYTMPLFLIKQIQAC